MAGKLGKAAAESICRTVLLKRFEKDWTAVNQQRVELGLAVYQSLFKARELNLLNQLPKSWTTTTDRLEVMAAGAHYDHLSLGGDRIIPGGWDSCKRLEGRLADRLVRIQQAETELKDRQRELRARLMAVLERSTVKRLRAEWPEIIPFLPEAEIVASLPAIPAAQLNKDLGLC